MKKLSVLIALALCLTIGGAYAAWTFATGNVTDITVSNIGIGMEVEETGSKGTLSATFTPNYTVEPGVDNKPFLQDNTTDGNDLVITFTPDVNAEQSVKDDAIAIKIVLTIETAFSSGDVTDAITLGDTSSMVIDPGVGDSKWTKNGNSFTVTIDSSKIMGWLVVDDSKALTTVAEAEAFKAAVEAGKLTITVTPDVVAN